MSLGYKASQRQLNGIFGCGQMRLWNGFTHLPMPWSIGFGTLKYIGTGTKKDKKQQRKQGKMNSKTVILLRYYAGAFEKDFDELKREYQRLPWNERYAHKQRLRKELKM